jgi:hypothetical protein
VTGLGISLAQASACGGIDSIGNIEMMLIPNQSIHSTGSKQPTNFRQYAFKVFIRSIQKQWDGYQGFDLFFRNILSFSLENCLCIQLERSGKRQEIKHDPLEREQRVEYPSFEK